MTDTPTTRYAIGNICDRLCDLEVSVAHNRVVSTPAPLLTDADTDAA